MLYLFVKIAQGVRPFRFPERRHPVEIQMKKIKLGFNEPGRTFEIMCIGGSDGVNYGKVGCGATLEVVKDDLFTVPSPGGMAPRRKLVKCRCIGCGFEADVPNGQLFTNLPTKEEWEAKQTAANPQ